jgi:hypothetical protein
MKSLFTIRPDDDLDKGIVEQFCNLGIRETTRIEYKREFPTDLAKSIASFANTQGGIVLVGVDADSENRPILPLCGMDYVAQPEERVYQICASSIHPPIVPSVWVVPFEDPSHVHPDRVIIVIRVTQGETAHAVDGRKRVYVRTGNISEPFDIATVDQVMELVGRRRESANTRARLINQSRERFQFFSEAYLTKRQSEVLDTLGQRTRSMLSKGVVVRLQFVPVFPSTPLMRLGEIRKALRSIFARRHDGRGWDSFPPCLTERIVQDSVIRLGGSRLLEITEVNELGVLSFSSNDLADVRGALNEPVQTADAITYFNVIANALAMMTFGVLAYEQMGFYGLCDFTLEISAVKGRRLLNNWCLFGETCPDDRITFGIRVTPSELKNDLREHFFALVTRIDNAFGYEATKQDREELERLVSENISIHFATQYYHPKGQL